MEGSWNIINASIGYKTNSTIINFIDNKQFMMVGIHVNPKLEYIWTRVCDFGQNEHIHGFGNSLVAKFFQLTYKFLHSVVRTS